MKSIRQSSPILEYEEGGVIALADSEIETETPAISIFDKCHDSIEATSPVQVSNPS